MIGRRLIAAARGGGSFPSPAPPFSTSGPYDPALTVNEAILTQVHCHTTQSDGSYAPGTVAGYYYDAGYGALAITDHDLITTQTGDVAIKIPGNETSPTTQHILSLNSTYTRGGTTAAQTIIDGIVAGGGQAVVAHPKWLRDLTYAEMAALTDYAGLELHNAKCVTGSGQNPVTYPGYALDRWDQLLTNVRRDVWGFSTDDLHFIDAFHTYDVGRLHVFVDADDVPGVMSRIASGNFVADVSNYGVTPAFPMLSDEGIELTCAGAVGMEAWGASGLLASTATNTITYPFVGTEHYVRLVAVGDYTEGFGSALSDRWQAYSGTWSATGGVLALGGTSSTPDRLILRRHREGDFSAGFDAKLGAGSLSGVALMFNVLNADYWYMLRLGESGVTGWNNQLAVGYTTNGNFTTAPLDSHAITATEGTWYRVEMDYTASTGRIRAKVWDRDAGSDPGVWQIDVESTAWTNGAFGFRGNFGAQFDNLYVKGFRTYYQPVAVG